MERLLWLSSKAKPADLTTIDIDAFERMTKNKGAEEERERILRDVASFRFTGYKSWWNTLVNIIRNEPHGGKS